MVAERLCPKKKTKTGCGAELSRRSRLVDETAAAADRLVWSRDRQVRGRIVLCTTTTTPTKATCAHRAMIAVTEASGQAIRAAYTHTYSFELKHKHAPNYVYYISLCICVFWWCACACDLRSFSLSLSLLNFNSLTVIKSNQNQTKNRRSRPIAIVVLVNEVISFISIYKNTTQKTNNPLLSPLFVSVPVHCTTFVFLLILVLPLLPLNLTYIVESRGEVENAISLDARS